MVNRRFILPGMGADSRMYNEQWRSRFPGTYVSWPKYSGESSLAEIAERLIRDYEIGEGDALVGSSLGGMIASEISRRVRCSNLVLLGSATSPTEVSSLLSVLHPLVDSLPISLSQVSASSLRGALFESFSEANPQFLRAMTKAIFKWTGHPADGIKPFRVHGRFDLIIPPPLGCDLLLNAGHMIAVTNADECISAIIAKGV